MPPVTDPVLLLFGGLYLWWIGAAIVSVMRSRKPGRRKLLWSLAIVLLSPFALVTYYGWGRDRKRRGWGVTGYLSFAAVGAGGLLTLGRPLWVGHEHAAWIVAWSLVTFVVYAIDKAAAKRTDAARVDELALHGLAVLGGFAGAWIGRHGLRHKTQKPMFGLVLLLATALHVGVLVHAHW